MDSPKYVSNRWWEGNSQPIDVPRDNQIFQLFPNSPDPFSLRVNDNNYRYPNNNDSDCYQNIGFQLPIQSPDPSMLPNTSLFSSPPRVISLENYTPKSPDSSPRKNFHQPQLLESQRRRELFPEETNLPPTNILESTKTSSGKAQSSKVPPLRLESSRKRSTKRRLVETAEISPRSKLPVNDRLHILRSLLEISGRSIEKPFDCYLDLGCGNGQIFRMNANYLRPKRAFCADLNEINLPGFIPVVDNTIQLSNKSVDLMTCLVSLHHFEHLSLMIREIVRVMIPGGYLFIREHDVVSEESVDVTAYLDLIHMIEFIRHGIPVDSNIQATFYRQYWSHQDLSNILRKFGFEEIGYQKYPRRSNPQRLYHTLYQYDPDLAEREEGEISWTSQTDEFSLDRNNLIEWLKTQAKNSQPKFSKYHRSYYRWFCETAKKKLSLPRKSLDRMIRESKNDLQFYEKLFERIHPNVTQQISQKYAASEAYIVDPLAGKSDQKIKTRKRSNSSPAVSPNIPIKSWEKKRPSKITNRTTKRQVSLDEGDLKERSRWRQTKSGPNRSYQNQSEKGKNRSAKRPDEGEWKYPGRRRRFPKKETVSQKLLPHGYNHKQNS